MIISSSGYSFNSHWNWQNQIWFPTKIIHDINQKENTTILLVEQNANLALQTAQRGYVLETGKVTMEDKADTLLHDPKIRKAYLGE